MFASITFACSFFGHPILEGPRLSLPAVPWRPDDDLAEFYTRSTRKLGGAEVPLHAHNPPRFSLCLRVGYDLCDLDDQTDDPGRAPERYAFPPPPPDTPQSDEYLSLKWPLGQFQLALKMARIECDLALRILAVESSLGVPSRLCSSHRGVCAEPVLGLSRLRVH